MTRYYFSLFLTLTFLVGCGSQKIKVPDFTPVNLQPSSFVNPPDFLIESRDLIDHSRAAGKVGDRLIGAQTDLELTNDLISYFESKTVAELESQGYRCARYEAGRDYSQLVQSSVTPPLHLRLELQDLVLSRQTKRSIVGDNVSGNCKIRGVLLDPYNEIILSQQYVGTVDTSRPTEQLVPSGVRFISHRGLSSLLTKLLERTVDDFRTKGVPQIASTRDSYKQNAQQPAFTPPPDNIVREPMQQPDRNPIPQPTPISIPSTPSPSEPADEDVEWVW